MLPSIKPFQGFGSVGSSGAYRGPAEADAGSAVAMIKIIYDLVDKARENITICSLKNSAE